MSTTLLFIELLIAGVQASVWIVLFLLAFSGVGWLAQLRADVLADWSALLTVVYLSFTYATGIIIDRAADRLFHAQYKKIGRRILPDNPRSVPAMRFALTRENDPLNAHFEYTRTRMRIARASALNFGLITLGALVFIALQAEGLGLAPAWRYALVVFLVGAAFVAGAARSCHELTIEYYWLIKTVSGDGEAGSPPPPGRKKG